MIEKRILKRSLLFSALAVLYVAAVATLMQNAQRLFGGPGPDSVFAPIGILLLLVVSAATMGMLVFGQPVMLYIDGKKREAVAMAVCTIGCLAVFTILVFLFLAASRA